MLPTVLVLAASAGLGLAETMEFLMPYADPQPFLASSIGSDASATTWLVGCPVDADSLDCGIPYPLTVTSGPRTVHYVQSYTESYTMDLDCELEAKTSALCTISVGGVNTEMYGSKTVTVDSTSGADLATLFLTATVVTDSASILNAGGLFADASSTVDNTKENTRTSVASSTKENTHTSVASSTSSSATPMITSTPTATSAPTIVVIGDSASATPSTTASTAGMPQITGNTGWAMGGMAAAMALAAL